MSYRRLMLARQLGLEHALTPTQRLLLESLADHRNEAKGYAWPSLATLARECGCKERTVMRDLVVLELKGLVVIDRRGGPLVSHYFLPFIDGKVTESHLKGDGATEGVKVTESQSKGDSDDINGDRESPNPRSNHVMKCLYFPDGLSSATTSLPRERSTGDGQESAAVQESDREINISSGNGNGRKPAGIPAGPPGESDLQRSQRRSRAAT